MNIMVGYRFVARYLITVLTKQRPASLRDASCRDYRKPMLVAVWRAQEEVQIPVCIDYLVDALAGRTNDGEHDGQKTDSGEEP